MTKMKVKGASGLTKKPKLPLNSKVFPKPLDSERKHIKQNTDTEAKEKSMPNEVNHVSVLEQTDGLEYRGRDREVQQESIDRTNAENKPSETSKVGIKKFKDKISGMKLKFPHQTNGSNRNIEKFEEDMGRHIPDSDLHDADYNPQEDKPRARKKLGRENSMQVVTGKYEGSEGNLMDGGAMSATRLKKPLFAGESICEEDAELRQKQGTLMEFKSLKGYTKLSVKNFARRSTHPLI